MFLTVYQVLLALLESVEFVECLADVVVYVALLLRVPAVNLSAYCQHQLILVELYQSLTKDDVLFKCILVEGELRCPLFQLFEVLRQFLDFLAFVAVSVFDEWVCLVVLVQDHVQLHELGFVFAQLVLEVVSTAKLVVSQQILFGLAVLF